MDIKLDRVTGRIREWDSEQKAKVPKNLQFSSHTELDGYFLTNPSELYPGMNVVVGGELLSWVHGYIVQGSEYNNNYWYKFSAGLTASAIKTLYGSNLDVEHLSTREKAILQWFKFNELDNRLEVLADLIVSPNMLYIGKSAGLSNNHRALNVLDPNLNRKGLLIVQEYDSKGSIGAYTYKVGAITQHELYSSSGQVMDTASFGLVTTKHQLVSSYKVRTNNTPGSVVSIGVTVKTYNINGGTVYEQRKEGTVDSLGYITVDMYSPIIHDIGEHLWVTVEVVGMLGTVYGGVFKPNATIVAQQITRHLIATVDQLPIKPSVLDFRSSFDTDVSCVSAYTRYVVPINSVIINKATNFKLNSSNTIEYTGVDSIDVSLSTFTNMLHNASNVEYISIEVRKNGNSLSYPNNTVSIARGETKSVSVINPIISVSTGDILELYIKTTEDNVLVTFEGTRVIIK